MKLKSFEGTTLFEAMGRVRQEFGSEALIVSTSEDAEGARVTAALQNEEKKEYEQNCSKNKLISSKQLHTSSKTGKHGKANFPRIEVVSDLLKMHSVPTSLIEWVEETLSLKFSSREMDLSTSNEMVFDEFITYRPLFQAGMVDPLLSSWMFVGASGMGKTVCVAKYAAEALAYNMPVEVITCDTTKAGAVAQLQTYMEALGLNLTICQTSMELGDKLEECLGKALVLIDTPGTNYRNEGEVSRLFDYIAQARQSPIYVTAAGGEGEEELERSTVFQNLGCTQLIMTKTDTCKRLAGALVPLFANDMSLCGITASPMISDSVIQADSDNFHKILTDSRELLQIRERVALQEERDDDSYKTQIQAY